MEPMPQTRLREASDIIKRTSSLQVLKLIFRFHLNPQNSREMLTSRWEVVLDSFLLRLGASSMPIEGMTRAQKVEAILREICPSGSVEMLRAPNIDMETWEDGSLTTQIDNTSYLLFKAIPFEAWVAVVVGRSPKSVEQFFQWHRQLCNRVRESLLETPEKYSQYQRLLHGLRCPFAKSAVQSAINLRICTIDSAVWFITNPLSQLLEDKFSGLEEILLRLNVLAQRYKRLYVCDSVNKVDWCLFRIDLAFPEALGDESYRQIANSITKKDNTAEQWLPWARGMITVEVTWEERAYEVMEFVCADSAFGPKFDKVALCLFELGNLHSLLPVLQGLELALVDRTGCLSPYRLPECRRNYANYQKAWKNGKGGVSPENRKGGVVLDETHLQAAKGWKIKLCQSFKTKVLRKDKANS